MKKFSEHITNRSIALIDSKQDSQCPLYSRFNTVSASEYSSLMPDHAKQVADIIANHFDGKKIETFMDATAHIGCDTINFYIRFGAKGISLEIDPYAFECLKMNQQIFNTKGYSVLCNCLDFVKGFKPHMDFVYLDPPWGGRCYKKKSSMMLFLEHEERQIPLHDVVNLIFAENFTRVIIIKVPTDFDRSMFNSGLNNVEYKYYPIYHLKNSIAYFIAVCSI